ncbi:hypothetical protein SLS62_009512 [Diatrype stigma]|uniref:Uncharacterized protein n=1 Tax=Diatrype stigma TaxID=117547 RepID=A0AAN9YIE2_9PEZI
MGASSNKAFGKATTGTEVAALFKEQIQDRNILITGVSPDSIGEATALAIANGNPGLLILASRTGSKLQEVARKVRERRPDVTVHTVVVDLASQSSGSAFPESSGLPIASS